MELYLFLGGNTSAGGKNTPQDKEEKAKGKNCFFSEVPLCGGDQGAFRSPPGPLRGELFLANQRVVLQKMDFVEGKGKGALLLFLPLEMEEIPPYGEKCEHIFAILAVNGRRRKIEWA